MLEQPEVKPLFSRVLDRVFHTRTETIQERFEGLDSLYEQVLQEEIGSERYNNVFHAYRWLKRQPDRARWVVFGREIPFWFDKSPNEA